MVQAFYKIKPTQDTPYRELVLTHIGGWQVRLFGGMKWGREQARELKVVPAESFEEARTAYDKVFKELLDDGWKPYSPSESW